MQLEELQVYKLAMEIGERIWTLVARWDFFVRDTVGKQLVRAADSVAANIGEGFGRFYYKEKKQCGYYARGSLYETKTWLTKANDRGLIPQTDFDFLQRKLETIAVKLNRYINSIGKQPGGAQPSLLKNQ